MNQLQGLPGGQPVQQQMAAPPQEVHQNFTFMAQNMPDGSRALMLGTPGKMFVFVFGDLAKAKKLGGELAAPGIEVPPQGLVVPNGAG